MITMSIAEQIPLTNAENIERENRRYNSSCQELWSVLDQVKDPEIPVITIWELGVLQNVTRSGDQVTVTITPTYSGCLAMEVIKEDILAALSSAGINDVVINIQLLPHGQPIGCLQRPKRRLRSLVLRQSILIIRLFVLNVGVIKPIRLVSLE